MSTHPEAAKAYEGRGKGEAAEIGSALFANDPVGVQPNRLRTLTLQQVEELLLHGQRVCLWSGGIPADATAFFLSA